MIIHSLLIKLLINERLINQKYNFKMILNYLNKDKSVEFGNKDLKGIRSIL